MSAQSRPGSTYLAPAPAPTLCWTRTTDPGEKKLSSKKYFVSSKIVGHLAEVESWFEPLHAEVEAEGDGVVLVVDGQHVGDLET